MPEKEKSLARKQMNALAALEKANQRRAAAMVAIKKGEARKQHADDDIQTAKKNLVDLGITVT